MSLKVALPDTLAPEETPEKIVDADIKAFDEWFRGLGNDPLIHMEKAVLKTYLWYKLRASTESKLSPPSSQEHQDAERSTLDEDP